MNDLEHLSKVLLFGGLFFSLIGLVILGLLLLADLINHIDLVSDYKRVIKSWFITCIVLILISLCISAYISLSFDFII